MEKIIIIGEVLRGNNGIGYNTNWIYDILSYPLQQITDIKIICDSDENTSQLHYDIYEVLGYESVDNFSWIEIYNIDPNNEILSIIKNRYDHALIIAFELHPLMEKAFNILGITYIKLMNHPIRYLDDIFFGMTSNDNVIFNRLQKHMIDVHLYEQHASFLKAKTSVLEFTHKINIIANSCLFLGQTTMDCSLLENNKIRTFWDYKDKILDISKQYDHFYYKVHPNGFDKDVIDFIYDLPNTTLIWPHEYTMYELFSTNNIKKYIAISSGALYEARFFGKEITYLLRQPFMFTTDYNDNSYDFSQTFVPVYKKYYLFSFWIDILKDYIELKDNIPLDVVDNFSNKIISILDMTWGYNDNYSVWVNQKINKINDKINNKSLLYRLLHLYWLRGK